MKSQDESTRIKRRIGRTRWIVYGTTALIVVAGLAWSRWLGMPWVAMRALTTADQYELISVDPKRSESDFHSHRILGSVIITDSETRKKLNAALQTGVRESNGTVMACFNPRHAIRVTHAGITTEFLICFECRQVQIWRDGKIIASFLTSPSPQAVFDELLQKANVPLAPKD